MPRCGVVCSSPPCYHAASRPACCVPCAPFAVGAAGAGDRARRWAQDGRHSAERGDERGDGGGAQGTTGSCKSRPESTLTWSLGAAACLALPPCGCLHGAAGGPACPAPARCPVRPTGPMSRPRCQVKSAVGSAGGKLELWWGSTMYHLDDLPFRCGAEATGPSWQALPFGRLQWAGRRDRAGAPPWPPCHCGV